MSGGERPRCVHCGEELDLVPYSLGPQWMHTRYPYNSRDRYWHCQRTVATPPTTADPVQLEMDGAL